MWEIIEKNGGEHFIKELQHIKDWMLKDGKFQHAAYHLETLRLNLDGAKAHADTIANQCIRAENSLTEILTSVSFLVKYPLVTIHDIDVQKYRHNQAARFEHLVIHLKNILGGYFERKLPRDEYMDNRSIILYNENKDEYLSLTPFIIDKNAFEKKEGELTDPYFYNNVVFANGDKVYVFLNLKTPSGGQEAELIISKDQPRLKIVHEQIEAFQKLLNL